MNKNWLIGSLLGVFLIAGLLRKGSSAKKFSDLLTITPRLKGKPSIKGGIVFGNMVIPVSVLFSNRTAEELRLRIQSVQINYKGKQIADIAPQASVVLIKSFAKTEYPTLNFEIPISKLVSSGVATDVIARANFNSIISQLSIKISIEVNGVSASISQQLSGLGHLGLVAKSKRKILPKSDYSHLIAPLGSLDRTDPIILQDGYVPETVQFMKDIVRKYHKDTEKLAHSLKGKTLKDTLKNIFDFVYNYIEYEMDSRTVEQLRRPLRTLHDQKGDCDCYSILIGSILHNLRIPFIFRVTAYSNPDKFQHVYVIVPKQNGGHYTVDPVLDNFNEEKAFSNHKDYKYSG